MVVSSSTCALLMSDLHFLLLQTVGFSSFKAKLACFLTKFLLLDNKLPVTRFSCLLACVMLRCYYGLMPLLVLQVRSLLSISEVLPYGDSLVKLQKYFNVQFAVGKLKA